MALLKKRILRLSYIIILLLILVTYGLIQIIQNHVKLKTVNIYYNNNLYITYQPSLTNANCSISWRKEHQIAMNNSYLISLNIFATPDKVRYKFNKVPQGTFTYWLGHIESQNKVRDKAFFADKYRCKQYIDDYKKIYPQFNYINHAQVIYDFDDEPPTFEQILDLKTLYKGFLIKPNHFSGEQIIINQNDNITYDKYKNIIKSAQRWSHKRYHQKSNGINREPWYMFIQQHVFIEENLNINSENHMTEYKIMVFNGKALYLYVTGKGLPRFDPLNLYLLPEFSLLNVTWANPPHRDFNVNKPVNDNLNKMIKFAEHFAEREQFNMVRVDLYQIGELIYFSEFTFSPIDGTGLIMPISFDYLLYDILCDSKQENIDKLREYIYTKNGCETKYIATTEDGLHGHWQLCE
eukprot:108965_1